MDVFFFWKRVHIQKKFFFVAAFILAVPVSIYRQLASLLVYKFVINFKFIE